MLSDRYIFTAMARAGVRGVDRQWIRSLYGFAIAPHLVFYLKIDVDALIRRVLESRGMNYWESGMDFLPNRDYYDAFVEYQSRLLAQFDIMVEEYHFHRIDATLSIREVFQSLTSEIEKVLSDMKPISPAEAERELSQARAEIGSKKLANAAE